MDVRRVIGENVRRIRLDADTSQEALAAKMGVDRAYISSLELGLRNITVITLWRAAEALGVEAFVLLQSTDASAPPARARRRAARRQLSR